MDHKNDHELCKELPWDSEFWGFPIAQVNDHTLSPNRMVVIDKWCQEHSISCLFFLANFDDPKTIRTAEQGKFTLVDTRVTAKVQTTGSCALPLNSVNTATNVRPAVADDIGELQRMARESFTTSRFYFDRRFPRERCGKLYEHWIAESCRGAADVVLVAESADHPVGYITCHLPTGTSQARMGLINVAAHARGHGIGQVLLAHAFSWYAERGVTEALGITQARNLSIQKLNDRCGFVTTNFQLWYHKWYTSPPGLRRGITHD